MLDKVFDSWNWLLRSVNGFEGEHWVLAFAVLLGIGFICMKGLGIRGAG